MWILSIALAWAVPARAGVMGGAIEGFVVDAKTGEAVYGATVAINGVQSTTTDFTGFYSLYMIPAGAQSVVASHADYHSSTQSVTVVVGQTASQNFELVPKKGKLLGRVMQADYTGISGAVVTDGTTTTTTDENGYYEISGILEGTYRFAAGTTGIAGQHRMVAIVGGEDEVIDFVLGRCILTGTVKDRMNQPQAGVRVTAGAWTDVTDATGTYFLYWVAPGAYSVTAHGAGFTSASQSVTLAGSQNLTRDFALYPAVPNVSAVQVTPGANQVTLTWTNPTGFTDFHHVNLYRSTTPGTQGTKIHETSGPTTATHTDTGLVNGKTYYYVLKAVDAHGNESDGLSRKTWTSQGDWGDFTLSQVDKDAVPGALRLATGQTQGTATYFFRPKPGTVQKWEQSIPIWDVDPRTPFNSVWIPNALDDTVSRINPATGQITATYATGNDPSRVAVDFHGNLWVGNRNMFNGSSPGAAEHSVTRITPAGVATTFNLGPTAQTIRAMAVDHQGYIWVGSYTNTKLLKLNPETGAILEEQTIPINPYGFVVDRNNTLWVYSPDGKLLHWSIAQQQVLWQQNLNSYIISMDQDGFIWMAGRDDEDVRRIDPVTHEITRISIPATTGTTGVGADREGTIWATDYNLGRVWRLRASDGFLYGIYPAAMGPVGTVSSLDGTVWVSCREANRVFRYTPSGRVLGKTKVGHWPYNYTQMTATSLFYSAHTAKVEYSSDGETWTTEPAQLAASEGIYLRVKEGSTHTAVSPLLQELTLTSLPQVVAVPLENPSTELLALVSPNGGEKWLTQRPQLLRWSSFDPQARIATVKLLYRTSENGAWNTIAADEPNDGVYRWILPVDPSPAARVRIEAYDSNLMLVAADESDVTLEIVAWGQIAGTVTDTRNGSPVAGVVVGDGTRTTTTNAQGTYLLDLVPVGNYTVTATKTGFVTGSQSVSVSSEQTTTLDFGLEAVGSVTGTVREARTNVPIRGVLVSDGTRTALTNGEGVYTLANVPPGMPQLQFSRSGYTTFQESVSVDAGAPTMLNVALEPVGTGRIAGLVKDLVSGSPLAGVTVQVDTLTTTTDASGSFTLNDLPPNSYTLMASKSGYENAFQNVNVNAGEVASVTVLLDTEGGDITGTVTAGEFYEPLAGVLVSAGPFTAVTDELGAYHLRNLPPGSYTVTASSPNHLTGSQSVLVQDNQPVTVNFILGPRVGRITGTITDASYYTGMEGSGMGYITVTDGTRTVEGSGGSYVLDNVPPGTYTVTARSGTGVGRGTAVVVEGQDTVLNLTVGTTGIAGTVEGFEYFFEMFGSEIPLAFARVAITDDEQITGQDGKYLFYDLEPGTYTVSAWLEGYVRKTQTVTVEQNQVVTLDFSLYRVLPNVTGLSVTNGDTQVTLSWTNPPSGTNPFQHHRIYRSLQPGQLGTMVGETNDNTATSYVDTSLNNGKTYFYTVKCVDGQGNESDARVTKTWTSETDFASWTLDQVSRTLVPGVLRLGTGQTSGTATVLFRPTPGMVFSAPNVIARRSWDPRPHGAQIYVPSSGDSKANTFAIADGAVIATHNTGFDASRMALAPNGDWWVGNRAGNSVTRIRKLPNGTTTVDTFQTGRQMVRGIAVDREGFVWVGHTGPDNTNDYHDSQLVKLDPETGAVVKFYYLKRFKTYGMLMDWKGDTLWVTDKGTRHLIQFSLVEQKVVRRYNVGSYGMFIDRDERLWTVGTGPILYRIDPKNQEVKKFALTSQYGGTLFGTLFLHCLVDRNNKIWVTQHDAHAVHKYELNAAGSALVWLGTYPLGEDIGPRSLMEDREGKIWVINSIQRSVMKLDTDGTMLGTFTVPGSGTVYSHSDHNGFHTRPAGVDLLEQYSGDGVNWTTRLEEVAAAESLAVRFDFSAPAPAMGDPALSPTLQELEISALGQIVGRPNDSPTTPWLAVVAPNGGELLPKNSIFPVRWVSTDPSSQIDTITVRFSSDNGMNWSLVAEDLPNVGTYRWVLPMVATTGALIKVEAYDANGTLVTSDVSDATFTIDPSGMIAGTVTNSLTNQPFQGVTVRCGALTTLTDAQGAYTFSYVALGTQTVTATLIGCTSGSQQVEVPNGGTVTANFALTPFGTVSGFIKDVDSGAGIVGATVSAGGATAVTNALGFYLLPQVPAGSHTLTAVHANYTGGSAALVVNRGDILEDINLSLKGKGTLTGVVTDQVSGAAAAGVTVSDGTRTAITNASGIYSIGNVPTGAYQLSASGTGFRTQSAQVSVVPGVTTTTNFALWPIGTVSGTVTDVDGPLAGVTVTLESRTTTTNSQGEYVLTDIPVGARIPFAWKTGYVAQNQPVTVIRGETVTKNFLLVATGKIVGLVKDAETQIQLSEAHVSYGPGTVRTGQGEMGFGEPGAYTLDQVPPGTYVVVARKNGYHRATQTVEVKSKQTTTANFLLEQAAEVVGVVSSSTGTPLAGVVVSAGAYNTTTAADGSYALRELLPGTYTLTATKAAYQPVSQPNVAAVKGQTLTVNLSLTLIPTTGDISGVVTHSVTGDPISGVRVQAVGTPRFAITGLDGSYTVTQVPGGTYTVKVTRIHYLTKHEANQVVVNGETLTLNAVLTPEPVPGHITGTVRRSNGRPVAGVTVSCGPFTDVTGLDGTYLLDSIQPGMRLVTATKTNYQTANETVNVGDGQTVTLNLVLTPNDQTVPTLTDLTPANGATTRLLRPQISATISDGPTGWGVDPESIELVVNGFKVPHLYHPLTGKLSYTPAADVANGTVDVRLRALDLAGNEASTAWSFTVDADTSPPSVTLTSPSDDPPTTNSAMLRGSIWDSHFPLTYYVKVKPVESNTWTSVKTGTFTEPITNGDLVELNTTVMVNGRYEVTLELVDQGGNRTQAQPRQILLNGTLKVGQFTRTEAPDLAVPYPGAAPFALTRTYNSHLFADRPFTFGWSHSFSATLVEYAGMSINDTNAFAGSAVVALPDGNRIVFTAQTYQGGNRVVYATPAESKDTLVRTSEFDDGWITLTYTVTTKDGSVYRFSGIADQMIQNAVNTSTLEAIADRFGNTITVAPGGNSYTDTTGRSISLTPHGTYSDRIGTATFSGPDGVTMSVGYDYAADGSWFKVTRSGATANENGELTNFTTATTEYQYQAPRFEAETPRLSRIVPPGQSGGADQPVLEVLYDLTGRMERQKNYVTAGQFSESVFTFDPQTNQTAVATKRSNGTIVSTGRVSQNGDGVPTGGEVQPADTGLPTVTTQATYGDAFNRLAPTQTQESSDGVNRYQGYSYHPNGNLTAHRVYRGTVGGEAQYRSFSYETSYNQPTVNTTYQGYEQNGAPTGKRVEMRQSYAKADGNSGSSSQNKYLTEQKTLLSDPDGQPNTGDEVYATTRHTYDTVASNPAQAVKGLVAESISATGNKTKLYYDAFGSVIRQEAVSADGTQTTQTHRKYKDSLGRVLLEADLSGGVKLHDYDGVGRRYRTRAYEDNTALYRSDFTPNSYTSMSPLTTRIAGYDAQGRQVYVRATARFGTDELGTVKKTNYTLDGKLLRLEEYSFRNGETTPKGITDYTYDDFGNRSQDSRSDGSRTWTVKYFHDSAGRLTDEKHYGINSTSTIVKHVRREYYNSGLKKREITFGGDGVNKLSEIEYVYDSLERLIRTTVDPGGRNLVTETGYDAAGNRIVAKNPKGAYVFYRYDNANRQISESSPIGGIIVDLSNPLWPAQAKVRLHRDYWADGQLRKETRYDADGTTVLAWKEITYDQVGRVSTVTQPIENSNSAVTTFAYRDPGQVPWSFMGDGAAYTKRITDAGGKSTYHALDGAGRLVKIRHPDGKTEEKEYFDNGKVKSEVVFLPNGTTERIYYRYTDDGQVFRKYFGDPTVSLEFTEIEYDAFGRRKTVIDNRSTTHRMGGSNRMEWTYDALGGIEAVTLHDGRVIKYDYAATGQRTRVRVMSSMGATEYDVAYTFDSAERLQQVSEGGQIVATYTWDANGNVETLHANPIGSTTTTAFDLLNQPIQIRTTTGAGTLAQFDFTTDALGRRTQVQEQLRTSGGVTLQYAVQYSYDQLGRLLGEQRTSGGVTVLNDTYAFDGAGNRQTKDGSPYTYAANSDKLATDPSGNNYAFDSNGNEVSKGGWVYEFDWNQQLKKAIAPDGKIVEFWYDPDGNRIRKVVSQDQQVAITNYTVDTVQAYPQVIVEQSGTGAITARYTYGHDLLRMWRNGQYYYHIQDAIGSTRIIIDAGGVVRNRYTYDAYGNLLLGESEEGVFNEYLFAGERIDSETGLVYLRARYFDPTTGRFLQLDPLLGEEHDPSSLHRYGYAQANPVTNTDPTGLFTADEGMNVIEPGIQLHYNVWHGFQEGEDYSFGTHQYYLDGGGWAGPDATTGDYWKPDIFNWNEFVWMEIKPLSKRGIAAAVTAYIKYNRAFGPPSADAPEGFVPDTEYQPSPVIIGLDGKLYWCRNVGGILFYASSKQLWESMKELRRFERVARRHLRNAVKGLTDAVVRIRQWVRIRIAGDRSRVGPHMGAATMFAMMGAW